MIGRRTGTVRATGLGSGGNQLDAFGRDYKIIGDEEREAATQRSPREIVAGIHERIAAKSPEHARLVAEFERRQAAREQQP